MNNKKQNGIHWSFWIISAFALLWNVTGIINFFAQMNPDMLTAYLESERAIIESRPAWATAGFAIAVFSGALGSLLLLFKKSVAYYLFVLSLLGVIVTMTHALGVGINFGLEEILGIILMPIVLSAFLIWYTKTAEGNGWIS